MSDSLQPHRLYPTRLLCPWDSRGKNTGVRSHSPFQGIFLTQESNLDLPHCRQILYLLRNQGSPGWEWGEMFPWVKTLPFKCCDALGADPAFRALHSPCPTNLGIGSPPFPPGPTVWWPRRPVVPAQPSLTEVSCLGVPSNADLVCWPHPDSSPTCSHCLSVLRGGRRLSPLQRPNLP